MEVIIDASQSVTWSVKKGVLQAFIKNEFIKPIMKPQLLFHICMCTRPNAIRFHWELQQLILSLYIFQTWSTANFVQGDIFSFIIIYYKT